jgi:sortase (surface protein transpeptidase)
MNLRPWGRVRLAAVLSGLVLLLGSAALVAVDLGGIRLQPSARTTAPAVLPSISPAPSQYGPLTSRPRFASPQRIAIPSIGVEAAIEPVGVGGDLRMGVPADPADAGWYSLGSSPGHSGDAVIDGHLDTPTGVPAVFAELAQVQPGADIRITMSDSQVVVFRVAHASWVPYQSPPAGLFTTDGAPRLTLITCSGSWDSNQQVYTQRLVVDAVPAGA